MILKILNTKFIVYINNNNSNDNNNDNNNNNNSNNKTARFIQCFSILSMPLSRLKYLKFMWCYKLTTVIIT